MCSSDSGEGLTSEEFDFLLETVKVDSAFGQFLSKLICLLLSDHWGGNGQDCWCCSPSTIKLLDNYISFYALAKKEKLYFVSPSFFCKQCNVHLSKSHSNPPKIWNPQSILWFGTWHYEQQQSWPGKKLSCCCCTCCRGCCGRCYRSSSFSSCCCYCRRIFRSSCCLGEN